MTIARTTASLFIAASLFGAQAYAADDPDVAAIRACVEHYWRASDANDSAELRLAFHPTNVMYSVTATGAVAGVSRSDWAARLDAAPSPRKALVRSIVWLDVEGDAAAARLRADYSDFFFDDYVLLLKLDGRWRIVGKIFYRGEKGSAAVDGAPAVARDAAPAAPAAPAPAAAPAKDVGGAGERAAIETVIRAKLAAMDANDGDLLATAYHPRAMTYSPIDGELVAVSIAEWQARFRERRAAAAAPGGAPAGRVERKILSIDAVGTTAVAKFEHDFGTRRVVDYATLLKTGEGWRIVGLLYVSRPARAAR